MKEAEGISLDHGVSIAVEMSETTTPKQHPQPPPIQYSATMPHPRKGGLWGPSPRRLPSLVSTGTELREELAFLAQNCQDSGERVSCQLKMLRKELKSMRMQDQTLLRQLLRIYAMISDLCGCANDRSPSNQHSAPITPDEVPELLTQSGHLDIRDIVSRLSPIRRRRGSDPEALYGADVAAALDFDENEIDDVLSMSCPIFV